MCLFCFFKFETRVKSKIVNICHDVSGEPQQSIFILEDRKIGVKVEGVLFDDYYLHKIKISHLDDNHEKIVINENTIDYNGKIYKCNCFLINF